MMQVRLIMPLWQQQHMRSRTLIWFRIEETKGKEAGGATCFSHLCAKFSSPLKLLLMARAQAQEEHCPMDLTVLSLAKTFRWLEAKLTHTITNGKNDPTLGHPPYQSSLHAMYVQISYLLCMFCTQANIGSPNDCPALVRRKRIHRSFPTLSSNNR